MKIGKIIFLLVFLLNINKLGAVLKPEIQKLLNKYSQNLLNKFNSGDLEKFLSDQLIKDGDTRLIDLEKNIEDKDTIIQDLTKELSTQKAFFEKLEKENKDLKENKVSLANKILGAANVGGLLANIGAAISNEDVNKKLKQLQVESDEEKSKLQKEYDDLLLIYNNLQSASGLDKKNLQDTITRLNQENENLKKEHELEKISLNEQISGLTKLSEEMVTGLKERDALNEAKDYEIAQLKDELKRAGEIREPIDTVAPEVLIGDDNEEIDRLNQEIAELRERINQRPEVQEVVEDEEFARLTEENANLNETAQEQAEEIKQLKEQNDKLDAEKRKLEEDKLKFEQEREATVKEINSLINKRDKEIIDLNKTINDLKTERKAYQENILKDIDNLIAEKNELLKKLEEDKLRNSNEQLEKLKTENISLIKERDYYYELINDTDIIEIQAKNTKLEEELKNKDLIIAECKTSIDALNKTISDLEIVKNQSEKQKKDLSEIKRKNIELETKIEEYKKNEKEIQDFSISLAKAPKEISDLKEEIENKNAEIKKLQEEKENETTERIEKEKEAFINKTMVIVVDLQKELDAKNDDYKKLEKKLNELESRNYSISNQYDSLVSENKRLQDAFSSNYELESEKIKLEKQLKLEKEKYNKLDIEKKDLINKNIEIEKKLEEIKKSRDITENIINEIKKLAQDFGAYDSTKYNLKDNPYPDIDKIYQDLLENLKFRIIQFIGKVYPEIWNEYTTKDFAKNEESINLEKIKDASLKYLYDELSGYIDKYIGAFNAKEDEIKKVGDEYESLLETNSKLSETNKQLREEVSKYINDKEVLNKQIETLKQNNNVLSENQDEFDFARDYWFKENKEKDEEIQKLEKQIIQLNEDLEKMINSLNRTESEYEDKLRDIENQIVNDIKSIISEFDGIKIENDDDSASLVNKLLDNVYKIFIGTINYIQFYIIGNSEYEYKNSINGKDLKKELMSTLKLAAAMTKKDIKEKLPVRSKEI